ncbi:MAG TPA: cysteine dioxygenase family protein [Thermoanaerobaculia bacterium]|jgi:cysteine dioxygenase
MNLAEMVREILADAGKETARATPGSLAGRLARETERCLDRVRFSPHQYMRHPILLWEDWEVMLIAWQSGQVTPIHDHRGVMGGMAVLSGALAEERFTTPGDIPKPTLADDRVRPEGDLSEIGPTVLHRLYPTTPKSVSLHIYRPPLRTMGIWDERGMNEIRPSSFDVGEEILARAVASGLSVR